MEAFFATQDLQFKNNMEQDKIHDKKIEIKKESSLKEDSRLTYTLKNSFRKGDETKLVKIKLF